MIGDAALPTRNWWAVGREDLTMLGHMTERHQRMLQVEIASVLNDPHASPEDKRWADGCDLLIQDAVYRFATDVLHHNIVS
jgi:hypothetical protein